MTSHISKLMQEDEKGLDVGFMSNLLNTQA